MNLRPVKLVATLAVACTPGITTPVPVVEITALRPPSPTTLDPISVTYTATQGDASAVAMVTWTGPDGQRFDDDTLPPLTARRGERWTVTVRAESPGGSAEDSQSVVIGNAPPDSFDAAVGPASPVERLDDLHCDALTPPTDADGDTVTLRATWTVNGMAYAGATRDLVLGGTVAAASTVVRDAWVCTLVADDRQGGTTAATPVAVVVGARIAIETVSAPPGRFFRGASTHEDSLGISIPPRREVTLTRPFEIGRYEVTRDEWAAFMGSDPSQAVEGCDGRCPVTRVSWHDAAAFTDSLSASAGLPACYDCVRSEGRWTCREEFDPYPCRGYRLPTAAEWEYAARDLGTVDASLPLGGDLVSTENETCDDSMYVGGVPASEQGVVCTLGPERVGGRSPNHLGLYDVIGNVAEWTHDQLTGVPPASQDPYGVGGGGFDYLLKGGRFDSPSLWDSLGVDHSAADRGWGLGIGMRIARTLPRSPPTSSPSPVRSTP